MNSRSIFILFVCATVPLLSGCLNGVKASEYSRADVGDISQVEAGTVLSQRTVILKSWWPFGTGPGGLNRRSGDRLSQTRRGVTYIVRVERTGETISVTQADDVTIANGSLAWIEFGGRTRLSPRN
jgi:hypothetical protein